MIGWRSHAPKWLLCICLALTGLAAAPAAASAAFGFASVHVSFQQQPATPPATVEAAGPPDFQAGSHPYQIEISEQLNAFLNSALELEPEGMLKDLSVEMPPGLIGNTNAMPQCPMSVFAASGLLEDDCPATTQVGVAKIRTNVLERTVPLTNLVPAPGYAAQFGVGGAYPAVLSATLRSTGEYALTVEQHDISQVQPITGISVTIWGVPADPSHDRFRGKCLETSGSSNGSCPTAEPPVPLLTLPNSCSEPLTTSFTADSWEAPGIPVRQSTTIDGPDGQPGELSGCERLEFQPTLTARPESAAADSPTGVTIEMGMPYNNNVTTLAGASLRELAVALPAGMSINPAAAAGLSGCMPAQIALEEEGPPTCPDASKAGTFEMQSPVLANPLQGAVYLAQPARPFDGVLGIYLTGEADGLKVKLAGQLRARSSDGQLTFVLSNAPQLPITALNVFLWGGPRAAIASPPTCGVFETTSMLTPYSASASGGRVARSNDFAIDEACGEPFAPSFKMGTTNSAAGHPSGLSLQMKRTDGQPYLQSFNVVLPPGLLANIDAIARCGEAEATVGACPPSSEVGTATVGDGAGSEPNYLTGHVYLTGPYKGAPYGVAMVMQAEIGPFDLGTVIVRGKIAINLATGSMSIEVEPLPAVLSGIPLRVKSIQMTTSPNFMVNPTSCNAEQITGTAYSRVGTSAALSAPFQVAGCANLPFTPALTATSEAPASRKNGVGLDLKIVYPPEMQASAKRLVVELPRQVRGRLSTIQQTCLAKQYAQNPAQCPPAAAVGSLQVNTKVLPDPLAGPIYLVSGPALLPTMQITVEGDGVSERLSGKFEISKHGITRAVLEGLPDAPVSSIVINLPRGANSMLGTDTDLCKRHLTVRYSLTARSGASRKGTTKLAVAHGCPAGRSAGQRATRAGHAARR